MRKYTSKNRGQKLSQAERVIAKFGGARALSAALASVSTPRDPSVVYKWTYPKERGGTDGRIPTNAWDNILKAARKYGIILTAEDLDPRERTLKQGSHDE